MPNEKINGVDHVLAVDCCTGRRTDLGTVDEVHKCVTAIKHLAEVQAHHV